MNEHFWVFFNGVTLIGETLILIYLLDRQLERGKIRGPVKTAAIVILIASHFLFRFITSGEVTNLIVSGLFDLIYAACIFPNRRQFIKKIALVANFYLVMISFDLAALLAYPSISIPDDIYQILATVVTRIAMMLLYILTSVVSRPRTKRLKGENWLVYLPVPIISAVTLLLNFSVHGINVEVSKYTGYLTTVFALLLNSVVFLLLQHIRKENDLRGRLEMLEKHRTAQEAYYLALKDHYRSIRYMTHDIHHQISVASSMIAKSSPQASLEYLRKIEQPIDRTLYFTGNETVDTILFGAVPLFESKGVLLKILGYLPSIMEFDEVDLCAILSNALENALEACLKLPDLIPREVILRFTFDGWLQVYMTNPIHTEPVRLSNGLYKSTKEKNKWHGIGLESIKAACERQNGFLLLEAEDGRFSLTATLQPCVPNSREGLLR